MCTCKSCEYTNSFAGKGFDAWPRGEPKGAATSSAEYKAHQRHCGSGGLPKPWKFKPGEPPKFNTYGLVMPVTPAPRYVLDYIARGPRSTANILPGPDARHAKPIKARRARAPVAA